MNIIQSSAVVVNTRDDMIASLRRIELAGRTCYKSNDRITADSYKQFVAGLIKRGHLAMLEHGSFTVKFIVDRGVTHEVVRHRIASFAQESTRYCNYAKGKFNSEITVVSPEDTMFKKEGSTVSTIDGEVTVTQDLIFDWISTWQIAMENAEESYMKLINRGCPPELARGVLPTSTKAEIMVTMNFREWRHFFSLRAIGTTGKPHPQMKEVTVPLLKALQETVPVVFDDLKVEE